MLAAAYEKTIADAEARGIILVVKGGKKDRADPPCPEGIPSLFDGLGFPPALGAASVIDGKTQASLLRIAEAIRNASDNATPLARFVRKVRMENPELSY
jgi:hypothetical protein